MKRNHIALKKKPDSLDDVTLMDCSDALIPAADESKDDSDYFSDRSASSTTGFSSVSFEFFMDESDIAEQFSRPSSKTPDVVPSFISEPCGFFSAVAADSDDAYTKMPVKLSSRIRQGDRFSLHTIPSVAPNLGSIPEDRLEESFALACDEDEDPSLLSELCEEFSTVWKKPRDMKLSQQMGEERREMMSNEPVSFYLSRRPEKIAAPAPRMPADWSFFRVKRSSDDRESNIAITPSSFKRVKSSSSSLELSIPS